MPIPAVILGAAVLNDGSPSPTLRRRTLTAVLLAKKGLANKLIFSGGVGRFKPAEAEVMRYIANQEGIDNADIILDTRSTSTIETAENCARIIHDLGFNEAWIVTDSYHMCRSLLAFRVFRILGKAAPALNTLYPSATTSMTKARAREILACVAGAPILILLVGKEVLINMIQFSKRRVKSRH